MLFNSIDFAIFLPLTFILYWFVFQRNIQLQNAFVILASYVFYGWWNYWFLSLIVISSLTDYFLGLQIYHTPDRRRKKLYLYLSLLINLGFLGVFKYFNFFIENFRHAFTLLGKPINAPELDIILPVGISFYTFQTLSYSLDIYRGKIKPTRDITAFFAFVSFFPQLVAGPIERAKNLLPQFLYRRNFSYAQAVDGLRQILYGLFKKIVIADTCARYVNEIFQGYDHYSGSTLVLGAVFFSFQIYGDFSGYSDIAIGTSRLFGFNLMQNFKVPYFSRDIAEFWRRWHISLSTWFRDYLYIPLGGSLGSYRQRIRNVMIIFLVSGFWHGAQWTFLAWGFLNALYFLPLLLLRRNRKYTDDIAPGKWLPAFNEFFGILMTFGLTSLAWVFFRATNIREALIYYQGIFSASLFSVPEVMPFRIVIILLLFTGIEWMTRNKRHALENFPIRFRPVRWGVYLVMVILVLAFYRGEQSFIYFQF